jgi:hypothetical protein
MEKLNTLLEELNGQDPLRVFDDPTMGFFPREIELRRSPIEGRIVVTILGTYVIGGGFDSYSGGYEIDEAIGRIKLAWYPNEERLLTVIPWRTITQYRRSLPHKVRRHASRHRRGDRRLILALREYKAVDPQGAIALAEELKIQDLLEA